MMAHSGPLREFLELVPFASFAVDGDSNHVILWNKAAEKMFGWAQSEVVGKELLVTADHQSIDLQALLGRAIPGERITGIETVWDDKLGRRMHLLVWVASLERPQKPGPVWLVFAQDLTPTKHLEEQLLQALKMKAVGIQAGGLAHDLNNLYTTISGYGTLLQTQMKTKKGSAAALTRSYIDRIIGAADRSATLTGHLLAFSRGQALQPKTWNKTAEQRTDRELESESETQGGRETILLVDDIADLRKLVEAWLQQCGYTVLVASNGEEALRIAKTHESEIHLLLTDAVMPEMTGPQLAKRLKSIAPSAKVLFMSAYHETDVGISSEEGAFLRKPFSTSLLAEKVREVLREDPYLTERGKRPAAAIPAQRLKKKPSPRRSRETRRD